MTSATDTPVYPLTFDTILRDLDGATLSGCFQCQKCTSGCPVSAGADVKPHEIVRLAQLGARQELLSSRFIWECTSCGTCEARCPQGVDLPSAIDTLRRLSREGGFVAEPVVATFNDIFLDVVRQLGRAHELALMAAFKLRTRRFTQDVGKLPMMLRKGKFALMPRLTPGRDERLRLFRRAREQGKEAP
jgi:quinone-modifying oxidoreductase subunit QmoC